MKLRAFGNGETLSPPELIQMEIEKIKDLIIETKDLQNSYKGDCEKTKECINLAIQELMKAVASYCNLVMIVYAEMESE